MTWGRTRRDADARSPSARRSSPAFALRRAPLLLLLLTLTLPACGLWSSYDVASNGLRQDDAQLRRLLAERRFDRAFEQVSKAAPDDDLLALLYEGVVGYYAAEYEASAGALDRAALLAADRYTKSVSRAAASLLTSDYTLEYEPPATERLLIHYYAALDYLSGGDVAGAAVEARRLSALLARTEEDGTPTHELRRVLRYFVGAIFEAAGEPNDARVAYRHALGQEHGGASADSLVDVALPAGTGELVLVVERGFVAHRTEQAAIVGLDGPQAHALTTGDDGRRWDVATLLAGHVLAELVAPDGHRRYDRDGTVFVDLPDDPSLYVDRDCDDGRAHSVGDGAAPGGAAPGGAPARPPVSRYPGARPPGGTATAGPSADTIDQDRRPSRDDCDDIDTLPYILKIAWPAYEARGMGAPFDLSLGNAAVPLEASVSEAVIADFERERTLLVARTLARAAAKMAMTKALEREAAEHDEGLAVLAGLIGNAGALLTERADIRCWALLPANLTVVRLRLPAGEHSLRLGADGVLHVDDAPTAADPTSAPARDVPASSGRPAAGDGSAPPIVGLIPSIDVRVPDGGVTVAALRVWR